MAIEEVLTPLALEGSQWMNDYGWALLAVAGLFVFSLYIWSYISKYFEMAKAKESKYLASDIIDYIQTIIMAAFIIVIATATLFTASVISDAFKESIWDPFMGYILEIIFIVVIVMVAMLIVKILRRLAKMARIRASGEKTIHPSAVEFTSLLFSYVVYIVTAIIVILIFISMFPDINVYENMADFFAQNVAEFALIATIIISIYFLIKLSEAVLEDYKFRTDKFNPKEIDLLKSGIRYALSIIAFLTAIFGILMLLGMEMLGLVLVSMVIIFLSIVVAVSYGTIRNIVSGFGLMDKGPFNVGDRIRIGNDLICDVVDKGLIFTRVRTLEDEIVDIPNSELMEESILNYSLSGKHGISLTFKMSQEVQHEQVEEMITTAISRVEGISKDPEPQIFAKDLEGKLIVYELVVFGSDFHLDRKIRSDLIFASQEEFHKRGFDMLFD